MGAPPDGSDVTLIGCGPVVHACLQAAEELEKEEGISAAVINGRFIKPMDREMLVAFATRTGRIVTLEENSAIGGFGSGVMEILSEEGVVVPVKRIGLPDRFLPHASQKLLRQAGRSGQGRHKKDRKALAKFRIDILLADKGLAESREKAKVLVMAGVVFLNGERVSRADKVVDEQASIEVRGNPLPYVGYGGVKLEQALTELRDRG